VHVDIGLVHVQRGLYAQGSRKFARASTSWNDASAAGDVGLRLRLRRDGAEVERILSELQALAKRRYVSPYTIALVHVALQAHDAAFDWLEKSFAAARGCPGVVEDQPALRPAARRPALHANDRAHCLPTASTPDATARA